jgi:hypothetical protein
MQALIAEADWRVQYSLDYMSLIAFLGFAALFFAAVGYQVSLVCGTVVLTRGH